MLRLVSERPTEYEEELGESIFAANVTITQLQFMESFVEDLLNLQMMTSGVFELENKPFDP